MYNQWKIFKLDNTYHSELVSMCGEVVSEKEFKSYVEDHSEIQKIDKSLIIETLSDGCVASEYMHLEIDELRKINYLNEIIYGIENEESIPYPIFEKYDNKLVCLDGRHRLLICLKMNIIPSVAVIEMIPSNDDPKPKINKFRQKYFLDKN